MYKDYIYIAHDILQDDIRNVDDDLQDDDYADTGSHTDSIRFLSQQKMTMTANLNTIAI